MVTCSCTKYSFLQHSSKILAKRNSFVVKSNACVSPSRAIDAGTSCRQRTWKMAVLRRMTLAHPAVAVDVGISQAALANRHVACRTTRIERVDHDFDDIFSVLGRNDEFAVLCGDCLADHLACSVDQLHFLVGEGPVARLILQLRAGTAGRKTHDAAYSRLDRFPRGRSYPAHGPDRRADQASNEKLFSQNVHGV